MVEKYDTVEHRKNGEAAFRIREGKFKGIIYNKIQGIDLIVSSTQLNNRNKRV